MKSIKNRAVRRTRSAPDARRQAAGADRLRLVKVGREVKLELRQRLHMPREIFGRLVNVSPRAIADAEAGKRVDKLRRPYREVDRLFDVLGEVVDPDALGEWFVTPNDALQGFKPLEIIERGEIDRLWEMAYRLRSGLPG